MAEMTMLAPGHATTIEGAITNILQLDPVVSGYVGTRVHPFSDPQSIARPKVTYHRWGTNLSADSGGFTNDGPTGWAGPKLFIDAWADDLLTSKLLAKAVKNALNGFSGLVGNVQINCIQVVDVREQPGALIPGTEKPVQRTTLDVRVSTQE